METVESNRKMLLTDSGFYHPLNLRVPMNGIIDSLRGLLGKPFAEAKALFIPTAARDAEAKRIADVLYRELLWMGFGQDNIIRYEIGDDLSEVDLLSADVMMVTGGWDGYLLERIRQTGFEKRIASFLDHGGVYVGMSAGSLVMTPNLGGCLGGAETAALGFLPTYLECHCDVKPQTADGSLIRLRMNQAVEAVGERVRVITAETGSIGFDGSSGVFDDSLTEKM